MKTEKCSALILAGGSLYTDGNHGHLLNTSFDWIVGVDGGTRHALTLGVQPTVILGDMDSIDPELKDRFASICIGAGEDGDLKLDTEIAIEWALNQGAERIVVAGGLGGRFDQSLANVQLLLKIAEAGAQGVVTDGHEAVYLLCEKADSLRLYGPVGMLFSVLSLEPCSQLTIEGGRWPLVDYDLFPGDTRTLSNRMTDESVRFSLRSGTALVVVGGTD